MSKTRGELPVLDFDVTCDSSDLRSVLMIVGASIAAACLCVFVGVALGML